MVNGHLLKKGVREEEEDNVVIPLCKETKCLKFDLHVFKLVDALFVS